MQSLQTSQDDFKAHWGSVAPTFMLTHFERRFCLERTLFRMHWSSKVLLSSYDARLLLIHFHTLGLQTECSWVGKMRANYTLFICIWTPEPLRADKRVWPNCCKVPLSPLHIYISFFLKKATLWMFFTKILGWNINFTQMIKKRCNIGRRLRKWLPLTFAGTTLSSNVTFKSKSS